MPRIQESSHTILETLKEEEPAPEEIIVKREWDRNTTYHYKLIPRENNKKIEEEGA